jgi:hypothetical protein
MSKKVGEIYILTNPSFPEWVKIGYSDDADNRAKQLSNSAAVPFSFHVYATYDVFERLDDTKLHNLIDGINPDLRSVKNTAIKLESESFTTSNQKKYTRHLKVGQLYLVQVIGFICVRKHQKKLKKKLRQLCCRRLAITLKILSFTLV